jgi:uncharacterized membrane protein YphA (DoxX/SURF4 family)
MKGIGIKLYALAAIGFGIAGLASDDFAAVWQPVPAGTPGRAILAFLVAAIFLGGGVALLWRRTAGAAALVLAALYGLGVVLLHLPKIAMHPAIVAMWSGAAEQLAMVCGGLAAYALLTRSDSLLRGTRLVFGLCLLAFGAAHFAYAPETAAMVPHYLPPSQTFWVYVTGAAHVAAGLAILSGIQARLASILLTAMFASFTVLVHAPILLAAQTHFNWVMNIVNLALIGTAWIVAESYAPRAQVTPPSTMTVEPTT